MLMNKSQMSNKSLSVNDFTGSIIEADRVNYLNRQSSKQQKDMLYASVQPKVSFFFFFLSFIWFLWFVQDFKQPNTQLKYEYGEINYTFWEGFVF